MNINKFLNDFKQQYLDLHYRTDWNIIHLTGTSKEHQDMIYEICWWLHENNIPFLTEARFKSGYRPDVCVPFGLPKQIIEVRCSETERESVAKFKRIPSSLEKEILYVDAKQKFKSELIL